MTLIEGNFLDSIVALDAEGYRALLRRAGQEGVTGGQTYGALISACAIQAKAHALLTFNARHFRHLEAAGVHVVVPGAKTPR